MNYTKKAFHGFVFFFLTSCLASLLAYAIRILLARNLPPEQYGLFYAIFTFLLFFLIFASLGLDSATIKFIAEFNARKQYSEIKTIIISMFTFQLICSLLLIVLIFIFSKLLATYYFKTPLSLTLIKIFSFYVLSYILLLDITSILMGFQDYKWYSLSEPFRLIFTIAISYLLFGLGFKILAPIFGFIFGSVITFFILIVGFLKYSFILKYKIKNFLKISKKLFSFGIQVIFMTVGNNVISYLDILVLTYFVSLTEVGIYNVILPTAMIFIVFGTAISVILFPMISELWSKKDKLKIREGVSLVYLYSFVFSIPLLFSVFAFSESFLRLLFGDSYATGILAFRILLVGILCCVIASINNATLCGIGKPKSMTKIVLTAATINLILNFVLIPFLKMNGAAIATSVSYLVMLTLSTIQLSKFIKISPPWKDWAKTLFSGIIFISLIFIIKTLLVLNVWLKILICLLIASFVYIILIFLMKVIKRDELKKLIKRIY